MTAISSPAVAVEVPDRDAGGVGPGGVRGGRQERGHFAGFQVFHRETAIRFDLGAAFGRIIWWTFRLNRLRIQDRNMRASGNTWRGAGANTSDLNSS